LLLDLPPVGAGEKNGFRIIIADEKEKMVLE
jgi:hypothetical protein